jgi:YspA, cpYpsA-related SLOG family
MTRPGGTPVAYRILVTASRDWDDPWLMDFVLSAAVAAHMPDVIIIHGNYGDGDMMVDAWALGRGLTPERHDPDWGRWGGSAGPRRNAEMVQAGADICVAFIKNASRGATGCSDLARAAGIRTLPYRAGQRERPLDLPPGPAGGD